MFAFLKFFYWVGGASSFSLGALRGWAWVNLWEGGGVFCCIYYRNAKNLAFFCIFPISTCQCVGYYRQTIFLAVNSIILCFFFNTFHFFLVDIHFYDLYHSFHTHSHSSNNIVMYKYSIFHHFLNSIISWVASWLLQFVLSCNQLLYISSIFCFFGLCIGRVFWGVGGGSSK